MKYNAASSKTVIAIFNKSSGALSNKIVNASFHLHFMVAIDDAVRSSGLQDNDELY